MLQSIVDKLKSDSKYNYIFDSNEKMSFIMLSTGHYRNYETGKIMFLILFGNEPKLLVKFYKSGDNRMQGEFNIQKIMHDKYPNIISEPIEILHLNDFKMMIENVAPGKSLERYFYDNPFKREIQSVMKKVFAVYASMDTLCQLSTYEEFEKEVKDLIDKFNKSYSPNNKELSTINECVLIILKYFKDQKIYKRFSNGDFTPRNLIINNLTIKMIDFEFAEETHLYFLEWFRFFKIQHAITNKYLYEILHADIKNKYCISALREYSNYYSRDRIDIAYRLISEIKEYVMRLSIHYHTFHNNLKKEIQPLILETHSRLNEHEQSHDVIDSCESDKESSLEKKIFHDMFLKITNYKNDIVEQDERTKNYQRHIEEISSRLNEQDAVIKNYQRHIEEIQQSFVFRTLRKYDRLIDKIFSWKSKK